MTSFSDVATRINEWSMEQNLLERATNDFWCAFNHYQKEDTEEFQKFFGADCLPDIQVRHVSTSLILLAHDETNTPYIVIRLSLSYRNRYIGEYRDVLCENGEYADDYLVLDFPCCVQPVQ